MSVARRLTVVRGLNRVGLALYTALAVTVVSRVVDGIVDLREGSWVAFDDGGFGFGDADISALWAQWRWLWLGVWLFWVVWAPLLVGLVRRLAPRSDTPAPMAATMSVVVPVVGALGVDALLFNTARAVAGSGIPAAGFWLGTSSPDVPQRAVAAVAVSAFSTIGCLIVAVATTSPALIVCCLAMGLLPIPVTRIMQLLAWQRLLRDVQARHDDNAMGHTGRTEPVAG